MDIAVMILLEVFAIVFYILSMMGRQQNGRQRAGWAMIAFIGVTVSAITGLVLWNDGNLVSGPTTLAAANGNFVSDFNAISVLAFAVPFGGLIFTIRKIFNI